MKTILLALLLFISGLPSFYDTAIAENDAVHFNALQPEPQHTRVSQLVSYLLTHNHYQKKELDDSLGSEAFDRYLKKLDYNRLYFLKSDIDKFENYRYKFDDYIRSGRIAPAFEIFNRYEERFAERLDYIYKRLETEFDYTIDEYIETDRENAPWAQSREELDELWRKQLKNAALNLKLAGKNWEGIQKTLRKRYERIQKNINQFQSEDVFQLLMNSLSESFDPHTNYFSPKNFDDFKISMSQSFEGIGARLMTENDYTKVAEIIPGGPADKGRLLHANDKIIAVGQGKDGELVDVIGWRIDDVVQLIRGPKKTIVRLVIIPAGEKVGARNDTISIVRGKVKLEDRSAKGDTLQILHNGKKETFGIIKVPSFYSDFEAMRRGERNYKSTTRDVRNEIVQLKRQNVDGLIIDLRGNGGGFLNEAVDLAGLFIDTGPVVQVRSSSGRVNVEWDTNPGVAWDGPLIVLVDRLSASASEIFAAAIQDYRRGIIIGSQSFGKGTVQNPIDLNRYKKHSTEKWGQLKLTTAKFYRINGGSTQNAGVMPDISFPSRYTLMDIGESTSENALMWDQIDKLDYNRYDRYNEDLVAKLNQRHVARIQKNKKFKKLLEELERYKVDLEKTRFSLREDVRRAEREKSKKRDVHDDLATTEATADSASTAVTALNRMKVNVKKDLMARESAHILGDYILLAGN